MAETVFTGVVGGCNREGAVDGWRARVYACSNGSADGAARGYLIHNWQGSSKVLMACRMALNL